MKRKLVVILSMIVFTGLLIIISGSTFAKQTVTFLSLDVVNFRPMLEEFIAEFEAANPDVDIEDTFSPQLYQQVMTGLESGTEPDIVFIWSNAMIPYVHRGRLGEIPQEFEMKLRDTLYDYTLLPVTHGEKLYGVPYNFFPWFSMIMYNVDLWNEAGVDPTVAKEWGQFMQLAQKVTKYDASGHMIQAGFSAERDRQEYFHSWLLQLGGKPFNEDGSAAFNNELGRKVAQLYVDIYLKWKVDHVEFGETVTQFKKGLVASTIIGPWFGSIVSKDTPHIKFDYFKQPKVSEGPLYWALPQVWAHYISEKSMNKEAVWRFLDFLLQPEISARWSAFSGELSSVVEANKLSDVQDVHYLAPWIEIANLGVAEGIVEWSSEDMNEAIRDMLLKAVYGQATVDQAVSEAAQEVNRIAKRLAGPKK